MLHDYQQVGLKRVLGYSASGRCQTSTRYCRAARVLGIYNDRRKLCCKVACGDYFKAYLTSVVITVSTYLQYLGQTILLSTHVLTYFFMISRTKYTRNVLVGSPAVVVRDEIHCNKYPGTHRVVSVGYPGSKISTRFNPISKRNSNPNDILVKCSSKTCTKIKRKEKRKSLV